MAWLMKRNLRLRVNGFGGERATEINYTIILRKYRRLPTVARMSAPNATLYIKNLNDQVQKDELRAQLYSLFTTYGKIIDVVASKSSKMRGQAFLVFADLAGATTAMRACEGMMFYDKPMVRCSYHTSSVL